MKMKGQSCTRWGIVVAVGLLKGTDAASYPPDTLDPHGRVDALRAVLHDTSYLSEPTLFCPEYNQ